jgi:acyl-CoA synthetase (NDP forming)
VLPNYWSHANPVDLVGTIKEGAAERAVEAVVRSDAVDAVVVLGVIGMVTSPLRVMEEVQRVQERSGMYLEQGPARPGTLSLPGRGLHQVGRGAHARV